MRKSKAYLGQFAVLVAVLGLWEISSGDPRQGAALDSLLFGKPSMVWDALLKWLSNGTIVTNAAVTLREAFAGFMVGSVSAIGLGVVFGATRVGRTLLGPLVYGAYSVPRYGIAPLFIIWFGVGEGSKVALVVLVVFFYTFFSAYEGASAADQELIGVCRLMKASRWDVLRLVILPSVIVWVTVGLKISVPHAFSAAIFGEILAGYLGMGVLIRTAATQLDPGGMFAATLVTATMAICLNAMVEEASRRLMRWRDNDDTVLQQA